METIPKVISERPLSEIEPGLFDRAADYNALINFGPSHRPSTKIGVEIIIETHVLDSHKAFM